jgi:drug/metabolite transporter (DMT)-like permease
VTDAVLQPPVLAAYRKSEQKSVLSRPIEYHFELPRGTFRRQKRIEKKVRGACRQAYNRSAPPTASGCPAGRARIAVLLPGGGHFNAAGVIFLNSVKTLNRTQSELLLISLIIVRSSTFMMSKVLLRTMQPLNILSVRFVITFAFLMIFFWKKVISADRRTVFCGLILGALFIATMFSELMGLRTSDSTRIAFLENSAFVFVPLYESVLKRRLPGARSLVCAAVTLAGVACLTLRAGFGGFAAGDLFGLLAAMLYASAIVTTDRFSRRHDALTLGLIQMGGMALFSSAAAFLFTDPRLPVTAAEWKNILVLAVICSGFGFTFQPVAQRGTTSERAGFFCALAPVSAGILGHIFLHESLGVQGIIGAALVLTGLLIPHFWKDAEH